MALDRVVRLDPTKELPTVEELEPIVRHFFGAFAMSVECKPPHWILAALRGTHSHMFQHLRPELQAVEEGQERYVEMFVGATEDGPYLNVLTRHQDCATNALAHGLAKRLAQFYGGTLEEG